MTRYQQLGTIAVTDGRETFVSDGRHWRNRYPYERASLVLSVCRTMGIAQLWLTRDALDVLPADGLLDDWLAEARDDGWDCQPSPRGAGWWHCFQRGGVWGSVDLAVPWLDRGYHAGGRDLAWAAATSAQDLLAGLLAYEKLTGARFRRSPGATGTALLTALHARKHSTPLAHHGDFPPPAERRSRERILDNALNWIASDATIADRMPWLNTYDINGQYLAACASLKLATGAYEHVPTYNLSAFLSAPGHLPPGYWRLSDLWGLDVFGKHPIAAHLPWTDGRDGWVSTPMLQLLTEHDIPFRLEEAWLSADYGQPFQPWYKALRDARADLMKTPDEEGHQLALAAVKMTYAQTIGWLGGNFHDETDLLYRPDWRHTIISQARANALRKCLKAQTSASACFAWATDCGYFASASPGEDVAGFLVGTGLGQVKVKSYPMAAIIADMPDWSLRSLQMACGRYDAQRGV